MHRVFHRGFARSSKIDGHICPHASPIRRKFEVIARLCLPKADAVIASIDGCDPRHARRVIRGEYRVSADVLLALNRELLRPLAPVEWDDFVGRVSQWRRRKRVG